MALTRVFFDFGGTLAQVPATVERPWKVWVGVSRGFDLQLSETLVQHALEAVDEELEGQIYRFLGRTPEFWNLYDGLVMDRLRIRRHREEIGKAVDEIFSDPSRVRLFPETLPVLENLRSGGYHVGLISNHNDALLKILQYHGLDKLLETVTYSQEVGVEKPASEVFAKALERAHCSPADALHVGDSFLVDVEGARRAGLHAVWLNRGDEPSSADCLTIQSLNELPHILEMINRAE